MTSERSDEARAALISDTQCRLLPTPGWSDAQLCYCEQRGTLHIYARNTDVEIDVHHVHPLCSIDSYPPVRYSLQYHLPQQCLVWLKFCQGKLSEYLFFSDSDIKDEVSYNV